ncbi:hypothetical protein E2C01_097494 [Portunus trituberculatus]|uniref:Uncharacterized protein n=1 Tax=Portunus trituberculatus TaxID=210409 RepID=A0A5B7K0K8_PORTR|nr:hypothetical protein [Portunus trituberculatus]
MPSLSCVIYAAATFVQQHPLTPTVLIGFAGPPPPPNPPSLPIIRRFIEELLSLNVYSSSGNTFKSPFYYFSPFSLSPPSLQFSLPTNYPPQPNN